MNWTGALPVRPGCGGAAGATQGSAGLGTARETPRAAGLVRARQSRLCSGGPAPPPPHARAPRGAAPQHRDSPPGAAGRALPRCRGQGGPGGRCSGRCRWVRCPGPCPPALIAVPRAALPPRPGLGVSGVFPFCGAVCGPPERPCDGRCGRPRSPRAGQSRCFVRVRSCPAFSRATLERECSTCFQGKDTEINCNVIYFLGSSRHLNAPPLHSHFFFLLQLFLPPLSVFTLPVQAAICINHSLGLWWY